MPLIFTPQAGECLRHDLHLSDIPLQSSYSLRAGDLVVNTRSQSLAWLLLQSLPYSELQEAQNQLPTHDHTACNTCNNHKKGEFDEPCA